MSAKTSETGTDSDFEDTAAFNELEDEDEEDSIPADEDVADEDELESLVKESQMSIQDLLASYGLAVDTTVPKDSSDQAVPSSSSRGRRRAAAATPCPDEPPISPKRARPLSSSEIDNSSEVKQCERFHPSCPSFSAPALTKPELQPPSRRFSVRRTASFSSSNEPAVSQPLCAPCIPPCASPVGSPATPLIQDDGVRSLEEQELTNNEKPGPADTENDLDDDVELRDDPNTSKSNDTESEQSSQFWIRTFGNPDSPPSYDSEDDEDYEPSEESDHAWLGEIRIGEEYQANVPSTIASDRLNSPIEERREMVFENEPCCLWQPGRLSEADVIAFERSFSQNLSSSSCLASENTVDDEEALFQLMRCNYDTDEALQRLRLREVPPHVIPRLIETWSPEDADAFEKGLAIFNKNFRQIRQSKLRHKTVKELVEYYYLWKKTSRHDEFSRARRYERRRSPHPDFTPIMDHLVQEQELSTSIPLTFARSAVRNGPFRHLYPLIQGTRPHTSCVKSIDNQEPSVTSANHIGSTTENNQSMHVRSPAANEDALDCSDARGQSLNSGMHHIDCGGS